MSLETSQPEYFNVHKNTLNTVIDGISAVTSQHPDIIVEQDGKTKELHLIQTPYSTDTIYDYYEGRLTEAEATEIADIYDRIQKSTAENDFRSLQYEATMMSVMTDIKTLGAEEYQKSHPNDPTILEYESARRQVAFRNNITLSALHLIAFERYGSAARFDLTKRDQLVTQDFRIRLLSDQIESIQISLHPTEDEQILAWTKFFGNDMGRLIGICSGYFNDEEELDEVLSDMFMLYQGTSKEEEAKPILDQVRIRAINTKESAALRAKFQSDLPSADQLNEMVADINNL